MPHKLTLLTIAMLFVGLVAHRVWRYGHSPPPMPVSLAAGPERELFLTPGGAYTSADIDANGRTTPSERYAGFEARHDLRPVPGDKLCPITRTTANANCTWVINNHTYHFCCPPCISEFVRLAKENPQRLQSPAEFVQR